MALKKYLPVLTSALIITGSCFAGAATVSGAPGDEQKARSANEKMIARFRNEMAASTDVSKKRGLEQKILNLQRENALLDGTAAVSAAKVLDERGFEELSGADWERLSQSEKQRFIYTGIGGLERQGVFVSRSPQSYLEAMDTILAADASLKEEFLDNLFVFLVYDGEPQTRDEIDAIRKQQGA